MKNFVDKILDPILDPVLDPVLNMFDAISYDGSHSDLGDPELNFMLDTEVKRLQERNKQEAAKKEKSMNEAELLTKVITAITYLYRGDGVAPNVIVSALPNKKIYLSINRYDDSNDRYKKRIIFRTTKDNATEVLMDAVKWLVNQKKDTKNPIDELKELVGDSGNIINGGW